MPDELYYWSCTRNLSSFSIPRALVKTPRLLSQSRFFKFVHRHPLPKGSSRRCLCDLLLYYATDGGEKSLLGSNHNGDKDGNRAQVLYLRPTSVVAESDNHKYWLNFVPWDYQFCLLIACTTFDFHTQTQTWTYKKNYYSLLKDREQVPTSSLEGRGLG